MAVMIFAERLKPESIHQQMDNQAALSYIRKMGWRQGRGGGQVNQKMNQISKELWQFLIENAITIIVEYLPAKLNSLVEKDSSE